MRKPTKAIITDAGYASRYLPIAKTIPKGMLPIGNRPIMQLVVEECIAADIKEIIIVATPEGKPIYEDYFNNAVNHIRKQLRAQGKDKRYDVVREVLDFPKIRIIVQDPALPYGNGSPIVSARDYIADDEAFIAIYSDDVVFDASDTLDLCKAFEKQDGAIKAVFDVVKIFSPELTLTGNIVCCKHFSPDMNLLNKVIKSTKGYGFHKIELEESWIGHNKMDSFLKALIE